MLLDVVVMEITISHDFSKSNRKVFFYLFGIWIIFFTYFFPAIIYFFYNNNWIKFYILDCDARTFLRYYKNFANSWRNICLQTIILLIKFDFSRKKSERIKIQKLKKKKNVKWKICRDFIVRKRNKKKSLEQ